MSALPATQPERSISTITEEIVTEHAAAQGAFDTAVAHAIRCGELLTEAKAQVAHGEWGDWLDHNFPASRRSAQGYMRLAAQGTKAQDLAHLGIEGALKQLARPTIKTYVDDAEPSEDDAMAISVAARLVEAAKEGKVEEDWQPAEALAAATKVFERARKYLDPNEAYRRIIENPGTYNPDAFRDTPGDAEPNRAEDPEPIKVFEVNSERTRQVAEKARERLIKAIHLSPSAAMVEETVIPALIPRAMAVATDEEVDGLIETLDDSIKALRMMRNEIQRRRT